MVGVRPVTLNINAERRGEGSVLLERLMVEASKPLFQYLGCSDLSSLRPPLNRAALRKAGLLKGDLLRFQYETADLNPVHTREMNMGQNWEPNEI